MRRSGSLRTIPTIVSRLDTSIAQASPKQVDPFYISPEWRKLMAAIIAARGRRCEDPHHDPATREGRIYADHIRELRDGGAPLDPRNIMLRCATCHGLKTARARANRMAQRT